MFDWLPDCFTDGVIDLIVAQVFCGDKLSDAQPDRGFGHAMAQQQGVPVPQLKFTVFPLGVNFLNKENKRLILIQKFINSL